MNKKQQKQRGGWSKGMRKGRGEEKMKREKK